MKSYVNYLQIIRTHLPQGRFGSDDFALVPVTGVSAPRAACGGCAPTHEKETALHPSEVDAVQRGGVMERMSKEIFQIPLRTIRNPRRRSGRRRTSGDRQKTRPKRVRFFGAGNRTRTGTLKPARDFKSLVSTIPPHRHI